MYHKHSCCNNIDKNKHNFKKIGKPKITIVIPAYKTKETHLRRAIDIIVEQNFKKWELIVINDGADSKVKDIVFSYQDKISVGYINQYSQIRYFETANAHGGPSKSRNIGLKNARGEYIFFHDHDDYLFSRENQKSVLYNMYNEANSLNLDILLFNIYVDSGDKSETYISWKDAFEPFNKDNSTFDINILNFNAIWNNLFKTKFLKRNKIYFNEKLKIGSDFEIYYRYIFLTHNIKFSNNAYYAYNVSSKNSMIHSCGNIYKGFLMIKYIKKTLIQNDLYYKSRLKLIKNFAGIFFHDIPIDTIIYNKKKRNYVRKYLKLLDITNADLLQLSNKEKLFLELILK